MGCVFTKEEPKVATPEKLDSEHPFYVETTLTDVPKWAELEWKYLLRQTEMSTDQDNLYLATEKFNEGEKLFQGERDTFYEMMTSMGGQMVERRMSLKHKQDKFKEREDDVWKKEEQNEERRKNLESEDLLMKRKTESIQFREDESKEREGKLEVRRVTIEKHLLKTFEKIQFKEDGLKQKEKDFEKMRNTKEKHLSEGLKSLESEQKVMDKEYEKIKIREEELKRKEEEI